MAEALLFRTGNNNQQTGEIVKKMLLLILGLMTMGAKSFAYDQTLPKLNVIKSQILWAKDGEQLPNLSNGSALYLTSESERNRDPELYIVLMIEGKVYLQSGGQYSFSPIIDLGEKSIEKFRLSDIHMGGVPGKEIRFTSEAKAGHTYALILNTPFKRGIILFRVDAASTREVFLSYAVKSYSVHSQTAASEGESQNGPSVRE